MGIGVEINSRSNLHARTFLIEDAALNMFANSFLDDVIKLDVTTNPSMFKNLYNFLAPKALGPVKNLAQNVTNDFTAVHLEPIVDF